MLEQHHADSTSALLISGVQALLAAPWPFRLEEHAKSCLVIRDTAAVLGMLHACNSGPSMCCGYPESSSDFCESHAGRRSSLLHRAHPAIDMGRAASEALSDVDAEARSNADHGQWLSFGQVRTCGHFS